jgi:hypothetical protein
MGDRGDGGCNLDDNNLVAHIFSDDALDAAGMNVGTSDQHVCTEIAPTPGAKGKLVLSITCMMDDLYLLHLTQTMRATVAASIGTIIGDSR